MAKQLVVEEFGTGRRWPAGPWMEQDEDVARWVLYRAQLREPDTQWIIREVRNADQ
jgi:hypothetical protein